MFVRFPDIIFGYYGSGPCLTTEVMDEFFFFFF